MRRKKIEDQVIVITGASSGIGLATARMAASRGASVVLVARSEEGLQAGVAAIEERGAGRASYFVADVADPAAMRDAAEHAIRTFGRIDTWVNDAGVAIYARLDEVALEDMRRLFDVNFWGVVHGTRAAVPYLRASHGTLVNVGSIESDMPVPLHGAYSASKNAVKAFTETLRMELEKDGSDVSVSLVKPAAIDTPFFENAANYMEGDPTPPPPVYAPDTVARAILECAERPVREVVVGGAGRFQVALHRLAPRTFERAAEATMYRLQQKPRTGERDPQGSLYHPGYAAGRMRGDYEGRVMRSSAYTAATLHPLRTAALGLFSLGAVLSTLRLLART